MRARIGLALAVLLGFLAIGLGLGSRGSPPAALAAQGQPATGTPTATATATASPTPAGTAAAPATPTATAAPTRTATPAAPPTATATRAATPAATPIPEALAQQAAPDCPAKYAGGAQQLAPRTTTRVSVICTVNNPFQEPLDYSGTMTFTLGPNVSVAGGSAARGNVAVVGNQIQWGGFVLAPGETASATAELNLEPAQAEVGNVLVVFTGVTTTARVASGGLINLRAGPVTSSAVSGLAGGGLVLAPQTPGPAATGAGLPRVGTGTSSPATGWMALGGLLAVVAGGIGIAAARQRR
jgi:hypothetical protein